MLRKGSVAVAMVAAMLAGFLPAFQTAHAATEITFWHAMTGNNQKVVTSLVSAFNDSHSDIHVTEQNKGATYNDELNAVIAAMQQKQGPNLAQIFDLGTPLAIDSGFFTPVESVLSADQLKQIKGDVAGPVLSYFTVNGKLNSMPWNNSNPLLYYNKDMFKAAGLDTEKPPATWKELEDDCAKLMAASVAPNCISIAIYGWYFEQWMGLQGAEITNNGNGRAGRATETNLTSDAAKAIFTFWKDLADKKYWISTGKIFDTTGAKQLFASKQAAMMLESTGALSGLSQNAKDNNFTLGTGFFPANDKVDRVGVIVGGASLWVGAGHSDDENKATATFIMWLLAPEQMAKWHQGTGYLPITTSAQKMLTDQGWFTQNPGQKTAVDQLNAAKATSATAGGLMGPFPQIRSLVEQAIQSVTSGSATIDDALSQAKIKADQALADYNSRLSATPAATAAQ
ncbi:MAG TPA: ABC transporter substrate-binding protein [Aggregatilineales bacterium]|nr:ABC transporter substrate-binding protein [Aggregatilineales bacterium]